MSVDWDQRLLCPDGACVGLIGQSGTCKVCGRVAPDWGDERRRGLVAAPGDADGDGGAGDGSDAGGDGGGGGGEIDEIAPSAPAALGEAGAWQRRRLCSDGACIGVIGDGGRCKVCGKPASGEAAADEDDGGDDGYEDDEDDGYEDDEDEDGEDGEDGDGEAGDGDGDEEEEPDPDGPDRFQTRATGAGAAPDADAERRLCADGACIGVIGDDDRCKVCGKEAAA